jgi:hypothetical protein
VQQVQRLLTWFEKEGVTQIWDGKIAFFKFLFPDLAEKIYSYQNHQRFLYIHSILIKLLAKFQIFGTQIHVFGPLNRFSKKEKNRQNYMG